MTETPQVPHAPLLVCWRCLRRIVFYSFEAGGGTRFGNPEWRQDREIALCSPCADILTRGELFDLMFNDHASWVKMFDTC